MPKNDLILSLEGDTFAQLKKDFDKILERTIGNMEMKGANEAVITLKLNVGLVKDSISVDGGVQEYTRPNFKHDISSVMQVKDKMTGQFSGDYAMVWDEDEERFVLRKIDNGQASIFDDDYETVMDGEYEEVRALPMSYHDEPGGDDTSDNDQVEAEYYQEEIGDVDEANAVKKTEDQGAFDWLSGFIGQEMRVTEAMGNYAVRSMDNKVVLSSASKNSVFYCPAEMLAPHMGHQLVCASYGQDAVENIAIECEDCFATLFSLNAPDVDMDTDPDEYRYEQPVEE